MGPSVSARLVLLVGVLALAFVADAATSSQLSCNAGTYGGYTALASSSTKQTTCDRTSACYGSGTNSKPAACTFTLLKCCVARIIPLLRAIDLFPNQILTP